MKNFQQKYEQLQLLHVKEDEVKLTPTKRVNIVSLKMVKERSLLEEERIYPLVL